nr:MAG: hypothetical protein AM324_13620 [Candidatus Thorarchaeota archaeon SMTZ1-83]
MFLKPDAYGLGTRTYVTSGSDSSVVCRLHETQIGKPEDSEEAPGSGILRLALVILWSITILNYVVVTSMGQFYGIDVVFQMIPYLTLSITVTVVWIIIKVYWYYKHRI